MLEREKKQVVKSQIRLEIETAIAGILSAKEQVEMMQLSVKKAQKSFQIIQDKFEFGRV